MKTFAIALPKAAGPALFAALFAALALAGCSGGDARPADGKESAAAKAGQAKAGDAQDPAPAEAVVLSLGQEDIWVAGRSAGVSPPVITGSIQAERRADLRAEVASVVLRVARDNGERVRKGELLVKLDDAAIRDTLASADESLRAATRSLEGSERTYERLKSLQAQGMTSVQALEDAEVRRNLAQSEVLAARARVATARQQLDRTEVRAPFDGVIAARKVSGGDTATMGKELVQVIDPSSLRMEALVPAERVGELRVGQSVKVRVQGGAAGAGASARAADANVREGRIRRIDAVAQPVSRQVAVIVDVAGDGAPLIAGLYAEGTVDVPAPRLIVVPETALVRNGQEVAVWRLEGPAVKLRPVTLQPRDARTGLFTVTAGLESGDRILRSPGSRLSDGQRYSVRGG